MISLSCYINILKLCSSHLCFRMNMKDYWFCWGLLMVILLAANIGMYLVGSNLSILTWRDYFKFSAQKPKNLTRHAVPKSVLAGTRNLLKTAQNLTESAPTPNHTIDEHSVPKLENFVVSKSISVVKSSDAVEKHSVQNPKNPTNLSPRQHQKNKTTEKRPTQIKEIPNGHAEKKR